MFDTKRDTACCLEDSALTHNCLRSGNRWWILPLPWRPSLPGLKDLGGVIGAMPHSGRRDWLFVAHNCACRGFSGSRKKDVAEQSRLESGAGVVAFVEVGAWEPGHEISRQ